MQSKTTEFFQKRKANEPMLQNNLNASALQQGYNQPQMNMSGAMGRGMNPQQNFQSPMSSFQQTMPQQQQQTPQQQQQQQQFMQQQHMQQQLQRHAQQQQQQQQAQRAQQNQAQNQQTQPQMGMGAGMNMGMNPGNANMAQSAQVFTPQRVQMVNMAGNVNRAAGINDISKLAAADRQKVLDLGQKLYDTASEENRSSARLSIQQKMQKQQVLGGWMMNRDGYPGVVAVKRR